MTSQWIALAIFSLTLLPAGLAMASGWAPRRLRSRLTPVRPRGWAFLALYAAAPLNALPRLTHAASEVVLASTVAAGVIAAAGCVAAAAITMRSAADTAR